MKFILTSLTGLCLLAKGFSQVYHQIPSDSVYWVEKTEGLYDDGMGGYCASYTTTFVYPYSTNYLIQGNLYTEFRQNSLTTYTAVLGTPTCPGSFYQSNLLYAFLRNDSIYKTVLIYDSMNTHQEYVVYDFNMNLGDTVVPPSFISGSGLTCPLDTFIVQRIDSIDLGGEFRNRFGIVTTTNASDTISIVEGVGNDLGFMFGNFCPFEFSSGLICYHYKNLAYYPPLSGPSACITNLGMESEIPEAQKIIFPQSPNKYFVNNSTNSVIQIVCYDVLGKFMLKRSFHESGYLDFNEVQGGIYFMDILYNGQPVKPYKFIVQH